MLTLALSKGRIFDETLPLLKAAGIEVLDDPEKSRKLILATSRPDVRVVIVRASDVPTYVQYGGADLGVTGLDTLIEHNASWGSGTGLYQPLDLHIAKCRVSDARRLRLRDGRQAGLAPQGGDQVREHRARVLRGQRCSRRSHQALRQHGAR